MQLRLVIASSAVVACTASSPTATTEPDSDGDGLSDFAELHKYGTDPAVAESPFLPSPFFCPP